ncbi:hypothetical protein BJY24_006492 [Nocardia transvalensis]|uniref:Uncharacterized protein n=1 Tax=Nocardia transvalensis TaxID=37333 RepID=A0A7W9UMA5_9NOCA|nr:hypothetical protein [Nocardia transvalensis]
MVPRGRRLSVPRGPGLPAKLGPPRRSVAHLFTMLTIYYGLFLLLLEAEKLMEQILQQ